MADKDLDLRDLLARLVPPKELVVHDLIGNDYRVATSVSARKHVVIVRHLQEVLTQPEALDAANAVAGVDGGTAAGAVVHLVSLLGSDKALAEIEAAFALAFPDVLLRAREAAKDALAQPADLFSLEELAAAIIPLFGGLVRRSMELLALATPPQAV